MLIAKAFYEIRNKIKDKRKNENTRKKKNADLRKKIR